MDNSVQTILTKTTHFFKTKNIENARLEAELLLSGALKLERIQLYLKFDQPIQETELNLARDWVRRRASGEPLAYILGEKYFYRNRFIVNNQVLIPRPESEILVEWVVKKAKDNRDESDSPLRILDVGSGTGCLGLSVRDELGAGDIAFVDVSASALDVAQKNAELVSQLENSKFFNEDFVVFSQKPEFLEHFDFIISNPPYLAHGDSRVEKSVEDFEPHIALFADENGFALVRKWATNAVPLLKSGGWLIFEIGLDQDEKTIQHFRELGLCNVSALIDLNKVPRFVFGQKK